MRLSSRPVGVLCAGLALGLGVGTAALASAGPAPSEPAPTPVTKSQVKKLAKAQAKKLLKKKERKLSVAKAKRADLASGAIAAYSATVARSAQSVGANGVTGGSVVDRSLSAVDVAVTNGTVTLDIGIVPANQCVFEPIPTGVDLTGAAITVSTDQTGAYSNNLALHAAKGGPGVIRVVACNVNSGNPGGDVDPPPATFDYVAIR